MRIDALAVRLRPRTPLEAADLGVRLCQHAARDVYVSYLLIAVPVFALSIATYEWVGWLPGTLIWCAKPWLDRTIVFVLSRAAFGQRTTPADLWRAQRQVWWRGLLFSWTIRRLSPWRSLTEPVYQLEGFSAWQAGPRIRQLRKNTMGSASMMMGAFAMAESTLIFSLIFLGFWLTPEDLRPDLTALFTDEGSTALGLAIPLAYAAVVLFLEPFFVAAGFGMYLNRRADLEAWDIEQEFRRAFAA
jgi:hypothetical protein